MLVPVASSIQPLTALTLLHASSICGKCTQKRATACIQSFQLQTRLLHTAGNAFSTLTLTATAPTGMINDALLYYIRRHSVFCMLYSRRHSVGPILYSTMLYVPENKVYYNNTNCNLPHGE